MSGNSFKKRRIRYVETREQMNKIIELATSNDLTILIEEDKDYEYAAARLPLRPILRPMKLRF